MLLWSFAQAEGIITSGICEIGRWLASSSSEIALTSPTKYSSPVDICGFRKITTIIGVPAIHLLGLNPVSPVPSLCRGGCFPGCPTPQPGLAVHARSSPNPDASCSPPGWHNLLSRLLAPLFSTRTPKSRDQKEIQAQGDEIPRNWHTTVELTGGQKIVLSSAITNT